MRNNSTIHSLNSGRKRTIMNTNKNDKGFTLVELLIVIVILGILATVTVFAVRGITDQGQDSACKADAKTYEVAIETWYAKAASGPNARIDSNSNNHPSGPELQASGLIRTYTGTSGVAVSEGTGTTISSIALTAPCTPAAAPVVPAT